MKSSNLLQSKPCRTVIHYPQLDTVLMVEEYIKTHSGEFKKKSVWQRLPKKMMYQTYNLVFEYLLESGKIAQDREGKVCWIWNPKLIKKYISNESLWVR